MADPRLDELQDRADAIRALATCFADSRWVVVERDRRECLVDFDGSDSTLLTKTEAAYLRACQPLELLPLLDDLLASRSALAAQLAETQREVKKRGHDLDSAHSQLVASHREHTAAHRLVHASLDVFHLQWLRRELTSAQAEIARLREGMRWIPVTEAMPEAGRTVLAFFVNEFGHARRIRAEYAAPHTLQLADDDGDFGVEAPDGEFYCPEGWYEQNEYEETHWAVSGNVTHWMPLPSAPDLLAPVSDASEPPTTETKG